MRILILSQYFPPEPIVRLRDLTRHLVAQGHEVSVVTSFPSYPLGRVYDGYRLRLRARSEELGATVTRVFAVPHPGRAKLKRLLSYSSFAGLALPLGLLPRQRPDVAYAYHPPLTTGLAAALYQVVARVPFVYDVQDLWPDAFVAAGMLNRDSAAYRSLRAIENFIYRHASRINVLSDGMKHNLLAKGVSVQKISVISNWGDPAVYRPSDSRELRLRLGWEEHFVVMVAGNMGLTHGLENVIEAAARVQDAAPHILFVFVGSGSAKPALMAQTEARRLSNVVFYPQVSQTEAAQFINAADVMLVHLKEGEFSVPHRIFSYMLCGKPIIVAASGSTATLVQEHKCGWVCAPSDSIALSEVVKTASADAVSCQQFGRNGLTAAHGVYGRSHLLGQIEQTIVSAQNNQTGSQS